MHLYKTLVHSTSPQLPLRLCAKPMDTANPWYFYFTILSFPLCLFSPPLSSVSGTYLCARLVLSLPTSLPHWENLVDSSIVVKQNFLDQLRSFPALSHLQSFLRPMLRCFNSLLASLPLNQARRLDSSVLMQQALSGRRTSCQKLSLWQPKRHRYSLLFKHRVSWSVRRLPPSWSYERSLSNKRMGSVVVNFPKIPFILICLHI